MQQKHCSGHSIKSWCHVQLQQSQHRAVLVLRAELSMATCVTTSGTLADCYPPQSPNIGISEATLEFGNL